MNAKTTAFYLRLAIFNFIVLTVLGLVLRYMHIGGIDGVNYQFLLHSHSHFAFAGWMFFTIVLLVNNHIGNDDLTKAFKWLLSLTLISAYGMLISFYLQGYKAVSITFSTLFIIATYRFTYLVLKKGALSKAVNVLSYKLIRAALVFLCLSSIGPLALGPLMAAGFKGTPLYQDAIYLYLHFQMNGFMLLTAWGLFAAVVPGIVSTKRSNLWTGLFIYSSVLLYFVFTLWSSPGVTFQLLAALGASVNMVSWFGVCMEQRAVWHQTSVLAKAALIATTLKTIFQVFVCVPAIAVWTFSSHDLIIGYIHLLTLGTITPLMLDQMIRRGFLKPLPRAIWTYLVASVGYIAALFLQPFLARFGILLPGYEWWLFGICVLFLFAAAAFLPRIKGSPVTSKHDEDHFFEGEKRIKLSFIKSD